MVTSWQSRLHAPNEDARGFRAVIEARMRGLEERKMSRTLIVVGIVLAVVGISLIGRPGLGRLMGVAPVSALRNGNAEGLAVLRLMTDSRGLGPSAAFAAAGFD
jgi:hypothetical protein